MQAVDAYSNPMLRWIVRIALETGMRSSEISTLRRSQVDLKRRIVCLLETKNTLPRTVPLTSAAVVLAALLQTLAADSSPFAQAAGFGGSSESGAKRAVSLAAGTAGNLAKGIGTVAAEKIKDRVADTAGGRLASSLRASTVTRWQQPGWRQQR